MRAWIGGLTLATVGIAAALASPALAPAQEVSAGCTGPLEADLGYSSMTFSQGRTFMGRDLIEFGTEPVLSGIDPAGPGAGRLEEGDALVAVDGHLITTRAGALRFAAIRPGRPVLLTVRRGGRNIDVRIVPGGRCLPTPPEVPELPGPPHISAGGSGLLGVALSCNCSLEQDASGAERWSFREPPRVEAIGPGGAAKRAGLRPGDLIERIDGVPVTSPDGGRRFGALRPGQRVRLGILRGARHLEMTVVPTRQ